MSTVLSLERKNWKLDKKNSCRLYIGNYYKTRFKNMRENRKKYKNTKNGLTFLVRLMNFESKNNLQ